MLKQLPEPTSIYDNKLVEKVYASCSRNNRFYKDHISVFIKPLEIRDYRDPLQVLYIICVTIYCKSGMYMVTQIMYNMYMELSYLNPCSKILN